jgi:hypothetical protein
MSLYHHVYGRAFKVLAIATTDEAANVHMERTHGLSVIDSYGPLVIMADKNDEGEALAVADAIHIEMRRRILGA